MNELSQFDEMGAKFEAAYHYFTRVYALKNPPPEKAEVKTTDKAVVVGLLFMVLASVIVSGSRTIEEFGGGFVGLSAFVMLELGIVYYAYIRTKRHYNKERHRTLKQQMTLGLGLALAVAVVANIHAISKANNVYIADWIDTVILLLVAISAPILAFTSGDILGMEAVATQTKLDAAEKVYERKMKTWKAGLNRAWEREKAKLGVEIKVEKPSPMDSNGIPLENRTQHFLPSASTLGHKKRPEASKIVHEFFQTSGVDPNEVDPLELANQLQVGKSTVYNVLAELKARTQHSNGNGTHD